MYKNKKLTVIGFLIVVLTVSSFFMYSKVYGSEKLDAGEHTRDYIDFVDKFDAAIDSRSKNIVVTPGGKNNIFGTKNNYDLNVDNQVISIYEFETRAEANKHVRRVSVDGQFIEDFGIVEWSGTPHFFRKSKIIVFYVGDNKEILSTIEHVLGNQFAGK